MAKAMMITIGRSTALSGQHHAEEDVAKRLSGIKLYDKELMATMTLNLGLSEAGSHQRKTPPHPQPAVQPVYHGQRTPLVTEVFILQSRIIKQLAEERPPASFWAAAVTMCCGSAGMCCACSSTHTGGMAA